MPFYAHTQNKRLLWQTIQTTSLFQKATVDWSWFQRILELFSQKYYTDLTTQELLHANQETILYMMEDMETQLGIRKPRGLTQPGIKSTIPERIIPTHVSSIGKQSIMPTTNIRRDGGRREQCSFVEGQSPDTCRLLDVPPILGGIPSEPKEYIQSRNTMTMTPLFSSCSIQETNSQHLSEGTEMRSIGVPTQYGWYPPDIKSGGTSIGLGSLGTQTNDGGAQLRSHIDTKRNISDGRIHFSEVSEIQSIGDVGGAQLRSHLEECEQPIYLNEPSHSMSATMNGINILRESLDRVTPNTPTFAIQQDYSSHESIDILVEKMQKERDMEYPSNSIQTQGIIEEGINKEEKHTKDSSVGDSKVCSFSLDGRQGNETPIPKIQQHIDILEARITTLEKTLETFSKLFPELCSSCHEPTHLQHFDK
jgi:hypothetical protein